MILKFLIILKETEKKGSYGDIVISRLRSYLKEIAVITSVIDNQVFSSEYMIYNPKSNILSSNTLMAFCLTKYVQTILDYSQSGSAAPSFF